RTAAAIAALATGAYRLRSLLVVPALLSIVRVRSWSLARASALHIHARCIFGAMGVCHNHLRGGITRGLNSQAPDFPGGREYCLHLHQSREAVITDRRHSS